MPVRTTLYQRIFQSDLSIPLSIHHHQRYALVRRNCGDRLCLCFSFSLLLYIILSILSSSNFVFLLRRNSIGETAYKNAIRASSPISENKQICSADQVDIIFLIVSSSLRFLERESIRETWGSMSDIFGVRSQRLFVIGYQPGDEWYKQLSSESIHEQDLLYLTVDDNSITLKELHAYRWLQKYCPNVGFIFKTEDDLFVNSILLHEIVRELRTKPTNKKNRQLYKISLDILFDAQINFDGSRFLFGWAFQPGRPERNITNSPYYVSYKEYPNDLYPRYCSGLFFFYIIMFIPMLKSFFLFRFWVFDEF